MAPKQKADAVDALQREADRLIQQLLRSGDGATLNVEYAAREVVALMVEQNLVDVQLLERSMSVRLKRNDRSAVPR